MSSINNSRIIIIIITSIRRGNNNVINRQKFQHKFLRSSRGRGSCVIPTSILIFRTSRGVYINNTSIRNSITNNINICGKTNIWILRNGICDAINRSFRIYRMSSSHVHCWNGYRYTGVFYSSNNDNSSSNRNKNLQLIRDIIRRKYKI